jgi:pantoate--beta-alanine ligase
LFIFTQTHELQRYLQQQKAQSRTVGFVPTMGALHQGHIRLIDQSKRSCSITVCSVFVNPTQFNQQSDFDHYPRLPEKDTAMLLAAGCDVLFMPDATEIYPDGIHTAQYDFGALTGTLEGFFRPGHFDGVITVVKRLFEIVQPNYAFFGQKDFQQCMVVKKLITHFSMPVQLQLVPTVRESDGLAMSSRNLRLNEKERADAVYIYTALQHVRTFIGKRPLAQVLHEAAEIANTRLKTEYIAVVDATTFDPVNTDTYPTQGVALAAAWCGNVRLIDNVLL